MKKSDRKSRKNKTEDASLRANLEYIFSSEEGLDIPKALEKAWLNYIMDFEYRHRNAKYVSVWEFIGKPQFKLLDQLESGSIDDALNNLFAIMKENNILLDFCVDYPKEIIYRFITEELFQHEMQDIRMPGGNICFSYEEFHPNHDYDLRRYSIEHLEKLFQPDSMLNHLLFTGIKDIYLNNKLYNKESLADFIILFHDLHKKIVMGDYKIIALTFDTELNTGKVILNFDCCLFFIDGGLTEKKETITFYFDRQYDCWVLNKIECSLF